MANEEQLSILKQGVEVWNEWRLENHNVEINFHKAFLNAANLNGVDLSKASLKQANLLGTYLNNADLSGADLYRVHLGASHLWKANLRGAKLIRANLHAANLFQANLMDADLGGADLHSAYLTGASLRGSNFGEARTGSTLFRYLDLSQAHGLDTVVHGGPSSISTDTFFLSKGKIPEVFLRGCGLSDWEIEEVKLYNPNLSNEEVNKILYRIYDLRATQALQVSPLFFSYSHGDSDFVDKVGNSLKDKGIRYWRDIHDMKSGRIEKQIDQAIRQNPTLLLVLSKNSLESDWVEHEVRTGRELEKEIGHDVLCPVALDDSWKSSPWPKRVMEQIMEYNILDFSAWEDDSKFGNTFGKLIDGLGLFYKG